MKKILCWFWIHDWEYYGLPGYVRCSRCGKKDFEFIP